MGSSEVERVAGTCAKRAAIRVDRSEDGASLSKRLATLIISELVGIRVFAAIGLGRRVNNK
jgi:pseudouridine-5'-phosphate glycosidase